MNEKTVFSEKHINNLRESTQRRKEGYNKWKGLPNLLDILDNEKAYPTGKDVLLVLRTYINN